MENTQSKGMSKGCLIGLIVGGILVVIIAIGLTTCWIYKDDLVKNMKALIDIDMLSGAAVVKQIEVGHWPDTEPIKHTEWLMKMVDDVAADLGYGFGRLSAMWGVPEEGRFIAIGVPATCLWGDDDPYYHSIHDTVDKVNSANLKAAADTVAIVAWRLANQ